MWQVHNGLDPAFKGVESQLIQHQGNQNGSDQIANNFQYGNIDCVQKDCLAVI